MQGKWGFGVRVRDRLGVITHRVLDVFAAHPAMDWWLGTATFLVHVVLINATGRYDYLGALGIADRREVYTVAAGVLAVVGAFATAVLTIFISAAGPRMISLRHRFESTLRRSLLGGLTTPLTASAVGILCLVFDHAGRGGTTYWRWPFELFALVSVLRIARLALLFNDVFGVSDLDLTQGRVRASAAVPPADAVARQARRAELESRAQPSDEPIVHDSESTVDGGMPTVAASEEG